MTASFDDYERAMWAGQADVYQDNLAVLCAGTATALLDAAEVTAGTRMLDVGTGPGTVAGLADERGAAVTGVDAEPSMVELAARRVPGAEFRHGVLPGLPFPDDTFDVAVANFVLNHVGTPAAALSGMGRVVRPGGRVAVTIWPQPLPEAQRLWDEIFDAAGVVRPGDLPRLAPEHDFARTTSGLAGLMDAAGLKDIGCRTVAWTQHIPAEAWWNGPAAGIGLKGHLLRRQTPETIARIRSEYDARTAPYRSPDGVLALPTAAVLGVGFVP
ncbi:methyltransferase [Actinoplanes italicus]|uniref:Methyltransferase family protein n=1 Tax=Actinoplanes italicus TaxID=113567 RepID=A0A2T0KC20_9ACTN|nr:methyltransferase domain-containing protein [Actinoplanes italicus]PRX20771.1 methyltransferase family protein [Actinoplanes italicus]GIE31246.1 methyltransferase [Actinoplanes italicus]